MKILITGGAGYVGSVATRHLIGRGHQVRVLDSLMHGGSALLGIYPDDGFEFILGDVRSADTARGALRGVDAVVHLAAIVGDPACSKQPSLAKETNLDASLQMYRLSRDAGVKKFIFASTCSNYGRMADPAQFINENSELNPLSLYSETKVAVEKELLAASRGDFPAVTVLRFATVFGLSPRMRFDLTVNEFTLEMAIKRKVTVFGEQFWRPYIHVRDVARAIALVLEAPAGKVVSDVFNVGSTDQNYQKAQILDLIQSRIPGTTVEKVTQKDDPRDYRVSFEKISKILGFKTTRSVSEGIDEILDAIEKKVIADFDNPHYRN